MNSLLRIGVHRQGCEHQFICTMCYETTFYRDYRLPRYRHPSSQSVIWATHLCGPYDTLSVRAISFPSNCLSKWEVKRSLNKLWLKRRFSFSCVFSWEGVIWGCHWMLLPPDTWDHVWSRWAPWRIVMAWGRAGWRWRKAAAWTPRYPAVRPTAARAWPDPRRFLAGRPPEVCKCPTCLPWGRCPAGSARTCRAPAAGPRRWWRTSDWCCPRWSSGGEPAPAGSVACHCLDCDISGLDWGTLDTCQTQKRKIKMSSWIIIYC